MVTWIGGQIMTSGDVRIIGFLGYIFCCTFDHVSKLFKIGLTYCCSWVSVFCAWVLSVSGHSAKRMTCHLATMSCYCFLD
jgi:hypothetical protein